MADTTPAETFDPFAGSAIVATSPTTEPQREIWTACALSDDASRAFNESITLTFRGRLDEAAFKLAFDALIARHDSLRSTISADGLTLLVGEPSSDLLTCVDLSSLTSEEREQRVLDARRRAVETTFDLVRGPLYRAELMRLGELEHVLVFSAHHIVFDGWSNGVMLADLAALYSERLGAAGSPPVPPSFAEYARAQASLPAEVGYADEAYWLKRFESSPPSVELPSDRLRPPTKTYASEREDVPLDRALIAELKKTGASYKASLFATLFAAYSVLVYRLSQQEDQVIGIPSAGQMLADDAALVGHCVNMLPIRNLLRRDQPFSDLLQQVRSTLLDAQEHQRFTFGKLLTKLPLPRDPSRLPLVSVIFNLDRPAEGVRFPGLELTLSSNPRSFENFDLFLNIVEAESGVVLECQFNVDLFDRATVRRWMSAYETLLRGIASEPTSLVGALPIVSEAERARLNEWNCNEANFPREACVHDLVARTAASSPQAVACEFADSQLTYGELERQARAFAQHLRALGVKRGTLVGLCVERSPRLLVGALAIWKAGGAYVPMDPGYPRERLAQMLEDSAAPVLVTETAVQRELALEGARVAFIDELPTDAPSEPLHDELATPDDVAYVIYTSGSTGKPKGVLVPHRSVVNLLSSVSKQPGMTREDVVLAVTTLSFDIAVSEVWLPLTVGARIALVTREIAADGGLLRDVVEGRGVTFIDATPATYRLLLGAGWQGAPTLKLICTGEAMPVDLAQQLKKCCGSLWNGYGPTETTVWSTFWRVPEQFSRVLIGRPVDNTQIHVLDEQRGLVPINVPGEIYIGGAGVTLGYLNRPDLTAERFVPDPFTPGALMYRTGDLGRYLPHGEIECLGRNDNQVKLRGFRIELGEIESALGLHEALGEVAVIKREDRPGDAKLVAYFVPRGAAPTPSELRSHLKQTLPDYMVPAAFMALDRMPLTPSGKIDRKSLPMPEGEPARPDSEFVAPSTPMEVVMAELWSSMLGVGRISVHDDFFALGGHSLLASQILSRLRRDHGIALSFRKFFEAPTVAKLAKEADAARGSTTPARSPLVRRTPGTPVPLSLAQERITLMEQMHPAQQMTHNLPAAWRMRGSVDVDKLQSALDTVVERHETLRTVIEVDASPMRQRVDAGKRSLIDQRDLRSHPADERHARMMDVVRTMTATPFDLRTGPLFKSVLFRMEDDEYVYFTLRHNVIWDGWSYDVFLADLTEQYSALVEGRAAKLAELPVSYGDYVLWQREWLKSAEIAQQRDWWHKELDGAPADLDLPYDFARPQRMRYEGGTIIARFSKEQSMALTALGHRANTTLFMTLFTAYAALLHRYTGAADILVGLPVRGRPAPELENLIGSFTNTIVLRAKVNESASFLEFLKATRDRALDAFSHEQLPLELLEIRPPVVRALFSFQDARTRPVGMKGVELKQVDVEPPAAANDLMCWMVERHDHLIAVVNYSRELFETATVERLVRGFQALLDDVVRRPDAPLSSLKVVHDDDRDPSRAIEASVVERSLPQLLGKTAAEYPAVAALRSEGTSLDYERLFERSAALAAGLVQRGLQTGDVVATLLDVSLDAVAAAHAIWRAGGALLALDSRSPSTLNDQLLLISGAKLILAEDSAPPVPGMPPQLRLEEVSASVPATLPEVSASSLAWLHGVLSAEGSARLRRVTHGELTEAAQYLVGATALAPTQAVAAALSPASETFALEIALAVGAAATLELPLRGARVEDALLHDPSRSAAVAMAPVASFAELRVSGGKRPPVTIMVGPAPAELFAKLSEEAATLLNLRVLDTEAYAVLLVDNGSPSDRVRGRLLAPYRALVRDGSGAAAPRGVMGELSLARVGCEPSATAYRGRLRSESVLELKVRQADLEHAGQRFAPRAVAKVIEGHPAVSETHVALEAAGLEGYRLVCYFVPRAGSTFTETELRRQARAALPPELVPHVFVEVSELPRDAAGVVDESKLPSPFVVSKRAFVAPRTENERLLVKLFAEALGLERVSVHDNFFDLGGQSLLCLRVIDQIEKQTGQRLSPRVLLLNTVEQAASALNQKPSETSQANAPQQTAGVAGRLIKGLKGLLRG